MPTSPYFNHYRASNEQNLIEGLVIESIQQRGLDVAYIERTQDNIDYLYNEDTSNVFTNFEMIEMWPAFVDGFDGDQMMSVFGNEFKKSATFVVSKKRFEETFPTFIRPKEGDLIFMPITNAVLEIKFVEHESPFFEKGKQYVYEIKTEAFEYSYEHIETSDPDIDDIIGQMNIDDSEANPEDYADNDEIDTDDRSNIEYDSSNPFGIR